MSLSKRKTMLAAVPAMGLIAVGHAVPAALEQDHHHAHPGDSVKQEEHSALFDLVSDSDATHVAVVVVVGQPIPGGK
jgi:hypothetical protein